MKKYAFPIAAIVALLALWIFIVRAPALPESKQAATLPEGSAPVATGAPNVSVNIATTQGSPRPAVPGIAHKTAPIQLPTGSVRSYLPGLLQQASGPKPSAEAALAAFYALNACKFRSTQGEQSETSDLTKPTHKDCAGISSADWDDAPRLLKLAADLGNERAQLAYARKEPLDGKSLEDFIQRPEDLAEFKANANRYLISASEAGNLDAMWFLSEALRTGDLMSKNLAAAYQYKYAIYRVGGYPQSITTELSKLESQISAAEVKAAHDRAEAFLARCCGGAGPLK